MTKQILLHIGAPKTGTTYLQNWLERNQRTLEEAGIGVSPLMVAHAFAVHNLRDERTATRPDVAVLRESNDREALRAALDGFPQDRIVVSSEYFFLSDPGRVAAMCREFGLEVEAIILYVRRQDRIEASGYGQDVQYLGRSEVFSEIRYYEDIDWSDVRGRWRGAFPASAMRLHNYDFLAGELLKTFRRDLQLPEVATDDTRATDNPSLNALTTEIARMQNARGVPVEPETLERLQQLVPAPPFSLRPSLVRRAETLYLRANRDFAADLDYVEFGSLTMEGWQAHGADMAGAVSEAQLAFLLSLAQPASPAEAEAPGAGPAEAEAPGGAPDPAEPAEASAAQ
jgi:hypothetical protein